jgi:hypothetical protein
MPGAKRAAEPTVEEEAGCSESKLRRLMSSSSEEEPDDRGFMYQCSVYEWRNRRMECATREDKRFSSRRQALLYVAKRNSDGLEKFAAQSGRKWTSMFDSDVYSLSPNMPFRLESFLELSDASLQRYSQEVGGALSRFKAPEGAVYRCAPVSLETTPASELWGILNA